MDILYELDALLSECKNDVTKKTLSRIAAEIKHLQAVPSLMYQATFKYADLGDSTNIADYMEEIAKIIDHDDLVWKNMYDTTGTYVVYAVSDDVYRARADSGGEYLGDFNTVEEARHACNKHYKDQEDV